MSKEMEGRRFFVTGQSLKQTVLMGTTIYRKPKMDKGNSVRRKSSREEQLWTNHSPQPPSPWNRRGRRAGNQAAESCKGGLGMVVLTILTYF